MKQRIHISPSWTFHNDSGAKLDPQLFKLLRSINQSGKLTVAAKEANISYRHAWNLLGKAADFFDSKLVLLEKGRGAQLTALGEKLLWAEQRVAARLQPQMENLASELNLEIMRDLVDVKPILRLHASHGYAVALLPEFADSFQLDLQYKSPTEALADLNNGSCDMAGIHIPADIRIEPLIRSYRRYVKPKTHRAIRFITRQQGLMVRNGNPKNLNRIADLDRKDIRFIHRRKDSGTRALFDKLLADAGLANKQINAVAEEEYTHSAVAAYVAAGMADVGFGVEAAARQFGLSFIPVTSEHYLMICTERLLKQSATLNFIETISGEQFKQRVKQLAGYSASHCGNIESLDLFL